jgi:uncharacterized protein YrrD
MMQQFFQQKRPTKCSIKGDAPMQQDFPPPPSADLPPTQPISQPPGTLASEQYYQPMPPPPQPPPSSTSASQHAAPTPAAGGAQWVTFAQLRNHPLVNINEGREIGRVADVLLDEQRHVIRAFATKKGLLRGSTYVPSATASIGADAIIFQPGTLEGQDTSWLDDLPRASALIGARVLSQNGQVLGYVENIRFQQDNGMLLAFEITSEQAGTLHRLGRGRRLLPASSIISYGPDAIIARDTTMTEL